MSYERNITCRGCGAEYELFKHNLAGQRDKDSEECDVCRTTLISWNGGAMYTTKIIKKEDQNKSK